MPLSWNEIKSRATLLSNTLKDTTREEANAKPFLVEFINIFGISQKRVAPFEHGVKKIDDESGYIDLLRLGTLIIEMNSLSQDLDKVNKQAIVNYHALVMPQHQLRQAVDFRYRPQEFPSVVSRIENEFEIYENIQPTYFKLR
jgi:hypothetical protein